MPTFRKTPRQADAMPAEAPIATVANLDTAIAVLRAAGYAIKKHGARHLVAFGDAQATPLAEAELLRLADMLSPQVQNGEAPLITVEQLQAAADPRPPLVDVITAMDAGAPLPINLNIIDDNPFQPRLVYDEERIAAIAASIRQHGLLQAPLGRRMPDGRVQLAFGHSRLRAFRKLAAVIPSDMERFGRMPVLLRDLDDETMALHAWIENRDRKDLTAYEEAKAIERYTSTFGWTQKAAAEKLQLTQPTIANKLRLLKLPAAALGLLEQGTISERQAAALIPLAELPEVSRSTMLNVWNGSEYIKSVDDLVAKAAKYDSSTLRSLVERVMDSVTIPLAKQPWRDGTWDIPKVHAPRCADCPIRLKSSDRCPDKACADRKDGAHQVAKAQAAATAAGLPAKPVLDYYAYDSLSGVDLKAIRAKAAEKQCGNLGVMWLGAGYAPHKVDGHPNCAIICGHGRNKRCGCKASLARSSDPAASQEAKQRHVRAQIRQELIGVAEQAVAEALATPSANLWRHLLANASYSAANKLPKDADEPTARAAYAAELVREATKYSLEYGADYSAAKKALEKLLHGLGGREPWAKQPAPLDHSRANTQTDPLLDELRGALAGVRAWLDQEVDDTPDEEIRVNLVELHAILDRLEQLSGHPEVSDADYQALRTEISELEREVRELAADASEVGA